MHVWHECPLFFLFFFFNDTATTEIYTLSLHDALPICLRRTQPRRSAAAHRGRRGDDSDEGRSGVGKRGGSRAAQDRKSTRLNSSHGYISYAVFCLKKKTQPKQTPPPENTTN